jgi:hypothetical protein
MAPPGPGGQGSAEPGVAAASGGPAVPGRPPAAPDEPSSRGDARADASGAGAEASWAAPTPEPDLGDLVVVLLAGTLAGLRDRLASDGFGDAAELVADLVEAADLYIAALELHGG